MMGACFVQVASALIRRAVPGGDGALGAVVLTLEAVPLPANRARGSAKYFVKVALPGAADPWAAGVYLVDTRGYLVAWALSDVAKWLIKSLSGGAVSVAINMPNAAALPAQWTPGRVLALENKVSALLPESIMAAAADKVSTVQAWAESTRKAETLAAASVMVSAADQLVYVQSLIGSAPVDPPPVDPPPVDPPPVDPPPVEPVIDLTGWSRWEVSTARVLVGGAVYGRIYWDTAGLMWRIGVDLVAGVSYQITMSGSGTGALTLPECNLDMLQKSPYGDPLPWVKGNPGPVCVATYMAAQSGLHFISAMGVYDPLEQYGTFKLAVVVAL